MTDKQYKEITKKIETIHLILWLMGGWIIGRFINLLFL
jgi:hypothetical protein